MGTTRLEVFKFGIYVFAPIYVMYFTGIPSYFEKEVVPLRNKLFRLNDPTYQPPQATEDIHAHMDKLRERKAAKDAAAHE
ncbi:hypothetical protein GGF32_008937 [Allomyces javanicus]|nr:hypothetical protein GGF32_008937 [Allomyces javanicus]